MRIICTCILLLFVTFPAYGQKMKATATAHGVDLSWTAPATGSEPTGSLVYIFRGTMAGGESSTALNSTGIVLTTTTYSDSTVSASATYFYVAKVCDAGVCSAPSNEVSATIPLVSTDFVPISGFVGSAH